MFIEKEVEKVWFDKFMGDLKNTYDELCGLDCDTNCYRGLVQAIKWRLNEEPYGGSFPPVDWLRETRNNVVYKWASKALRLHESEAESVREHAQEIDDDLAQIIPVIQNLADKTKANAPARESPRAGMSEKYYKNRKWLEGYDNNAYDVSAPPFHVVEKQGK